MRIGIYHGYELTGSGSNEYTRYLARALSAEGHDVHVVCREPEPERMEFAGKIVFWDRSGAIRKSVRTERAPNNCTIHQIPHAMVRPVYLTDKQRPGNTKSFAELTDAELEDYHLLNVRVLAGVLAAVQPDVLHANHLVYQPVVCAEACAKTGTPFIIFPHGSAIEYTVRKDPRYWARAGHALDACDGIITGNREVLDRLSSLYPDRAKAIESKAQIVGVGVDTSLFTPVSRDHRRQTVSAFPASRAAGKTAEQTTELHHLLREDGISVTREFWHAYDHEVPDADVEAKLSAIPWGKNILLYVGALTAGKGVQSLIAAMPAILAREPDTHLVIVGSGAYREVLEALVYVMASGDEQLLTELTERGFDLDRSELSGPWRDIAHYLTTTEGRASIMRHGESMLRRVHFTGRLNHDELAHVFPCSDLALFPSIVPEAYPLVLMESLSNGVLPLVSYFSGFRDGVDELRPMLGAGLISRMKIPVEPETRISKLADNVNTLLSAGRPDACKDDLRAIAVARYDWSLRAGQLTAAYENVLTGRRCVQARSA
ncbi:MAG: glycosyltransferase family 4 protein [Pseudomonadota bacterium]